MNYDNLVIEKFKKGEINISDAFSALINNNKKNIKYSNIKDNKYISENNLKSNNNLDLTLNEMDNLVGLNSIKKIIREYIAYIQIQDIRKRYNLKTKPVVMHMIFKGNPGTGKTTIARMVGKIFKEIGFLNNGNIIEAERADLVGEYIGHTAQKTRKLIDKALGGVLFVDEAYSLARGGEKDFGKEAIDTMVKAMEDNKDNLIIILAGYRDEMDYFLETNPGLSSRFAIQLDFPDYTIDQLVKIADLMYKEREYILSKRSKYYIYNILSKIRFKESKYNGNARTVRNLVEKSIRRHAKRIMKNKNYNKENLIYIKPIDLSGED
ncbi:MAG: AAA family ATPase [bacterium]